MNPYSPAFAWQSRAILGRHLRVHLRNWYTVTLTLHWAWVPFAIPLLFLAALAFSAIRLYFTAILPSIDHMTLPFFLVIMPIGFASSTYFPVPDVPFLSAAVQCNPLHHLAEGL